MGGCIPIIMSVFISYCCHGRSILWLCFVICHSYMLLPSVSDGFGEGPSGLVARAYGTACRLLRVAEASSTVIALQEPSSLPYKAAIVVGADWDAILASESPSSLLSTSASTSSLKHAMDAFDHSPGASATALPRGASSELLSDSHAAFLRTINAGSIKFLCASHRFVICF